MNRHETDPVSLGFGVAFLALAGWLQLVASVEVDLPKLGWFVAVGLILCGLLGVFATVRPHRSGTPEDVHAAGRPTGPSSP